MDPALLAIAISIGKEIALYIQREGKPPTDAEIENMLLSLRKDNDTIDELTK